MKKKKRDYRVKVVVIQEGFRYCVNCEDEYLDTSKNWKRINKRSQTGKCTNCYNDEVAKYYTENPKYKEMKLKCNARYAAKKRKEIAEKLNHAGNCIEGTKGNLI